MKLRDRAPLGTSVLLVLLTLWLLPAAVRAHAELDASTPVAGSTVASPFDGPIVLTFTEALGANSEADLIGPGGATVASAAVNGPGATMTFRLGSPLDPGAYEVRWTSVADDGHVERGTFGFTVAPAQPTAEPTPEPTPTATASARATTEPSPTATPEPSASPSPSPTPDNSGVGGAGDAVLPIIVALVIAGAGAVYLLTRRDRPTLPG